MKFIKKFGVLFTALVITVTVVLPASAESVYNADFDLKSECVYLVNTDTGKVVYEKNKDTQLCPASLVKMMTVILALETTDQANMENFLNQKIVAKPYIFDRLFGLNASSADIRPNEELTMQDVIYAAMLPSACEATMILADYIDGENTEKFVEKMNNKAKEIGMEKTVFVDPDGLDEKKQRSTAYDMYLLTDYCLKNPTFDKIAKSQQYVMTATNKHPQTRRVQHTNHMMSSYLGGKYYDKRVKGLKTGTAAGIKNLISSAEDGSFHYVLVTMGAPDDGSNGTYTDALTLYEWVFKNLKFATIATPGEKIVANNIKVNMGKGTDAVMLTPSKQVIELLPKSIETASIMWDTSKLPKEINAPISEGQIIGSVDLKLNDAVIQTVEVKAAKAVELSILACIVQTTKGIVTSWWFILILIIIAIAAILYFMFVVRHNKKYKSKIKRKK